MDIKLILAKAILYGAYACVLSAILWILVIEPIVIAALLGGLGIVAVVMGLMLLMNWADWYIREHEREKKNGQKD